MRPKEKHSGSTWADEHTCSPAKFPFNVANTCKLWRDVVFNSPENWTELQFDLASDPHHLLGSIAASNTLLFSVHVFTTANDTSQERKSIENKRAQAVVETLLLHAGRCTCLVFDLTYASSLPSAAPFLARCHPELTDLMLDYKIYDLPMCYEGTKIEFKPAPLPLKKLSEMSMCGSAFMDIIHLGTEWLQAQSVLNHAHSRSELKLYLRDFEFPIIGNEMTGKEYTLARFIHLLHFINPNAELRLRNISLANCSHTSDLGEAGQYRLFVPEWASLTFESVSSDFIAEFLRIGNPLAGDLGSLDFVSCSIPPIPGPFFCHELSVRDVPAANTLSPDDDDESLYNLLRGWEGGSLELTACPSFNDEFIDWLTDESDGAGCAAYVIHSLFLNDCENFTVSAIQRLVTAVNNPARVKHWSIVDEMTPLYVYGRGPPLEDEDISWFEGYKGETTIYWDISNGDGIRKKFSGH